MYVAVIAVGSVAGRAAAQAVAGLVVALAAWAETGDSAIAAPATLRLLAAWAQQTVFGWRLC